MNDEADVIFIESDKTGIPLFVDAHVIIKLMGIFFWEGIDSSRFSYFPIVVNPPNFENLYISLISRETLKKHFSQTSKANFVPIERFDPLTFESSTGQKTFVYVEDFNDLDVPKIAREVLNPLGIGFFYSTDNIFSTKKTDDIKDFKYFQAPFSMEIVDRLLYKPDIKDDSDLNLLDAISLMLLHYPLRPLIAPAPASNAPASASNAPVNVLRRKVIFSRISLRNPPLKFYKKKLEQYQLNSKIPPFTWTIVHLDKKLTGPVFAILQPGNEKIDSFHSIKKDLNSLVSGSFLNVEPWENSKEVLLKFETDTIAIMSPFESFLYVFAENDTVTWSAKLYDKKK